MAHWCVTGGSGFIGRNLVARLEAEGEDVIILDLDPPKYDTKARHVYGDIGVPRGPFWKWLENADYIVHLAAVSGIKDCEDNPIGSFQTNVMGTHNVLQHAGEAKVIAASSGAVVAGNGAFTDVFAALAPSSCLYAGQKAALEGLCLAHPRAAVLRFSNVYGPGAMHKTSVVHAFVKAALRKEPLQVNDDGKQARDFIYVGDVVDAILAVKECRSTGVVHVGTEWLTSIADVAGYVVASVGHGQIESRPAVGGGVRRAALSLYGNPDDLTWVPKICIRDGIDKTVEWFRRELT